MKAIVVFLSVNRLASFAVVKINRNNVQYSLLTFLFLVDDVNKLNTASCQQTLVGVLDKTI